MRKPNFFIVGGPRCGSTALYSYLRQHPDIFIPKEKELNYFGIDVFSRIKDKVKPDIKKLEKFLDKDLSIWLK